MSDETKGMKLLGTASRGIKIADGMVSNRVSLWCQTTYVRTYAGRAEHATI